jgi:hypothetical protein
MRVEKMQQREKRFLGIRWGAFVHTCQKTPAAFGYRVVLCRKFTSYYHILEVKMLNDYFELQVCAGWSLCRT